MCGREGAEAALGGGHTAFTSFVGSSEVLKRIPLKCPQVKNVTLTATEKWIQVGESGDRTPVRRPWEQPGKRWRG